MHTDTPLGFALRLALLTSVLFLPANVLAQAEMTQPTDPAQQMSVEEVGMQRLDVIEVTATKQDLLSVQDVPFSVNVQSEVDLQRQNAATLEDLSRTVRDADGNVVGGVKEGNRLASVPEWRLSASGTYTLPGILGAEESYLSASWQYVGDQYTQPGDQDPGAGSFEHNLPFGGATGNEVTTLDLKLPAYSLVNLRAGLLYGNWELMLYVDNVTNENALLSFDRERGGRARLGYRVGQPLTLGATMRWFF